MKVLLLFDSQSGTKCVLLRPIFLPRMLKYGFSVGSGGKAIVLLQGVEVIRLFSDRSTDVFLRIILCGLVTTDPRIVSTLALLFFSYSLCEHLLRSFSIIFFFCFLTNFNTRFGFSISNEMFSSSVSKLKLFLSKTSILLMVFRRHLLLGVNALSCNGAYKICLLVTVINPWHFVDSCIFVTILLCRMILFIFRLLLEY